MSDESNKSIYALFAKVRSHPDFVGGTIFTVDDLPEGTKLPDDWREKWLSDRLAEQGNDLLDLFCTDTDSHPQETQS